MIAAKSVIAATCRLDLEKQDAEFVVVTFRKGTAKAPALDLFRLNTLGGTKTAFLISTEVQRARPSYLCGVPSPGLPSEKRQNTRAL